MTELETLKAKLDEQWVVIEGYPNYQVSSDGRVKCPSGVRKLMTDKDGYHHLTLWKNGAQKGFHVHRLVARAFLGDRPTPSHQVAHNDGNRKNNNVANLRWATCRENQGDRFAHHTSATGERNGRAILTEDAVREIRAAVPVKGFRQELAERFGIAVHTVSMVRWGGKGKWAHVS